MIILNYIGGSKGALVGNFVAFGTTEWKGPLGESKGMGTINVLKHYFFERMIERLIEKNLVGVEARFSYHDQGPQMRAFMRNPVIANEIVAGFFEEALPRLNGPLANTEHLWMLRRQDIDRLKAEGYRPVSICVPFERHLTTQLECQFKMINRPCSPGELSWYADFYGKLGLPVPSECPNEIDIILVREGIVPNDENRCTWFANRLDWFKDWMSTPPGDRTQVRMLDACQSLGIEIIFYDELFTAPYAGIQRLKPDADMQAWADLVERSWLPETISMWGRDWHPAEWGYRR